MQKIRNGVQTAMNNYYRRFPTSKSEAMKFCSTCGPIEPQEHEVDGVIHYRPVQCECEVQELARRKAEEERREYLQSMSRLTYTWLGSRWTDEPLQHKTFENFIATRQPRAYKVARAYAKEPSGCLVLHGTYGTGKTHLLAAICNEALAKYSIRSYFCTSSKLFAAMQQRMNEKADPDALIERAIKTPLLVLDDIDKAKYSEWRGEKYFDIIDGRVNAGRPIAISTNRLDELENFVGGAVCSRLKVGQIAIEMIGKDFREEL